MRSLVHSFKLDIFFLVLTKEMLKEYKLPVM